MKVDEVSLDDISPSPQSIPSSHKKLITFHEKFFLQKVNYLTEYQLQKLSSKKSKSSACYPRNNAINSSWTI